MSGVSNFVCLGMIFQYDLQNKVDIKTSEKKELQ